LSKAVDARDLSSHRHTPSRRNALGDDEEGGAQTITIGAGFLLAESTISRVPPAHRPETDHVATVGVRPGRRQRGNSHSTAWSLSRPVFRNCERHHTKGAGDDVLLTSARFWHLRAALVAR
jgi:hypothetical protein